MTSHIKATSTPLKRWLLSIKQQQRNRNRHLSLFLVDLRGDQESSTCSYKLYSTRRNQAPPVFIQKANKFTSKKKLNKELKKSFCFGMNVVNYLN